MELDSYADTGVVVSVELINALAILSAYGRPVDPGDPLAAVAQVLSVDPASIEMLRKDDVEGFVSLATHVHEVFVDLDADDIDAAAGRLNNLLALHPAHPHLAKEDGQWRLHHHPAEAQLVPMWTAICAEALARFLGAGGADRLGTCEADDCERVFVDLSKNGSRRFCSTTCQNRVKAAAFRQRRQG